MLDRLVAPPAPLSYQMMKGEGPEPNRKKRDCMMSVYPASLLILMIKNRWIMTVNYLIWGGGGGGGGGVGQSTRRH